MFKLRETTELDQLLNVCLILFIKLFFFKLYILSEIDVGIQFQGTSTVFDLKIRENTELHILSNVCKRN